MATKTVHIIPDKETGRWIVTKPGTDLTTRYATRKEATDGAKKLIKGGPGQVVILTEDGKIVSVKTRGLPKVQRPAVRSKLGKKSIEKAVSTVVRARLASN